jgi:hypothetical protein
MRPLTMRFSALRLPSFVGGGLGKGFLAVAWQASDAKTHRENGIALRGLPVFVRSFPRKRESKSGSPLARGRAEKMRHTRASGEAPSPQPSPRTRGEGVRLDLPERRGFNPAQIKRAHHAP